MFSQTKEPAVGTNMFAVDDRVVLRNVDVPAIGSVVAVADDGYEVEFYSGRVTVAGDLIKKLRSRLVAKPATSAVVIQPLVLTADLRVSA